MWLPLNHFRLDEFTTGLAVKATVKFTDEPSMAATSLKLGIAFGGSRKEIAGTKNFSASVRYERASY